MDPGRPLCQGDGTSPLEVRIMTKPFHLLLGPLLLGEAVVREAQGDQFLDAAAGVVRARRGVAGGAPLDGGRRPRQGGQLRGLLDALRDLQRGRERLADLLARAGFTDDQAQELQWHRIRWPLMSQEEADRRELNTLLNDLERQQLYCNREQLTEIVFSPVRKPGERWTERLQWLLMTDGFGFRSPLSREAGARALAILAGYTGREVTEHLATVMVWNDAEAGERP